VNNDHPAALRIIVDSRKNMLEVDVSGTGLESNLVTGNELAGTLDVGAMGRLIGIEIGDQYLSISDAVPGTEHLIRSVDVRLAVGRDRHGQASVIRFSRSGDHYEISFPSGNQCWQVERSGYSASRRVCSVVIT